MPKPRPLNRVNIRPGVSVLSVLSHLNYRPWFALAEFVDNALQSYLDNRDQLDALDGANRRVKVDVCFENSDVSSVKIRDNAAGISRKDFPRAFRPAQIPPNPDGLSEFGMGMKSAACWFSPRWSVRTSALGEDVEREIFFDIERIVSDEISELTVKSRKAKPSAHFTEIVLTDLHQVPVGRTVGKIKSHLSDIYRIFSREGILDLRFNDEPLEYQSPKILVAPFFKKQAGESITWKKDFDFDFGDGLSASGFAAIRSTASVSDAGFALFRRNRLIVGSADEGYRPEMIFGKSNSFPYQRVFGEIHLEGFDVSHTKDGFQWDENERPFLEILKEELTKKKLPLLQQAREYRVKRKGPEYKKGASRAADRTSSTVRDHVPPVLTKLSKKPNPKPPSKKLSDAERIASREIEIRFNNQDWRITLELSSDPAVGDWLEFSERPATSRSGQTNELGLRLGLAHPFMERFGGVDCDEIEPLLRIAVALGLSEVIARQSGMKMAGAIRRNINALLRDALCKT